MDHMKPGFYYCDYWKCIVEVVYADDNLREASFIIPNQDDRDFREHCDYRHFSKVEGE